MSREHELYKDKIEVSLDGRQIFYLFFGGAVIVGMVFVLGVMVGRRVEARGHMERAHVEAAVDPLAALDRLEGGAGLSFQGSLRGNEPTAAPEVDKKIAELAKEKAPEPAAKKKEEAKLEKKPEPKAEDKKAEDKKAEDKKEPKKDEVAKDDKKPEEKKPEPEKKPQKFTLQLSSFQDKSEAESYIESVKGAGFSPYIAEGTVEGKQYFRVRLGSYKNIDAANDAKAEFEKASKKSALVTKL